MLQNKNWSTAKHIAECYRKNHRKTLAPARKKETEMETSKVDPGVDLPLTAEEEDAALQVLSFTSTSSQTDKF